MRKKSPLISTTFFFHHWLCKCLRAGQTLPAPSRQTEGCAELPAPRGSAPRPLSLPRSLISFSRMLIPEQQHHLKPQPGTRWRRCGCYCRVSTETEVSSFPRDRKNLFPFAFIHKAQECMLIKTGILGELSPAVTSCSARNLAPAPCYQHPGVFAGGNIQVWLLAPPEPGFQGLQRCLKWYLEN